MNIFNNKKIRLLVAFAALLLLFDALQNSYAKYISSASATTNMTIASWHILINDKDITNNSSFSDVITPTFTNNANVKDGFIAPNAIGYFDLLVDSTNVDLSFTENINVTLDDSNTISDLIIYGYSYNEEEMIPVNSTSLEITKDYLKENNEGTNKYRIYVQWYEGEDENMDNISDTNATTEGIAAIKVNVNYIQKK